MAWVKLDDGFPDHPKVAQAGDFAAWLYVCGLTYANRLLTDGFIPESVVPRLTGLKTPMALAGRLVTAGLWELVEGGYQIHDYLTYQPAAGKVAQEREANAVRQAAWKRRQNGTTNEEVTALPEYYPRPTVTPLEKVPREEEEEEPGKRVPEAKNLLLPEGPETVVATTTAGPSADLLNRVNQTLTGQPGWDPTPTQLRKLGELAERHGLDLELEALKMADYMRKPKRKDTQCNFRFAADWLGREQRNGSNGHGENRQHPGRAGSGQGRAHAGPGAGGAGEDDPFAKYVKRDPVPSGDPGGP